MNDENFEKMLKMILSHEGGYVNNPNDKGGETNKGITHTTYDNYRKRKGLPTRSVKYITNEEVLDIYYNNYYKSCGADKLDNPQLAFYVFDTAVNMGPSRAQEFLTKSNGNLETFERLRREKYKEFAKNDPTQAGFLQGWQNRVTTTKNFALNNLPSSNTNITQNSEISNTGPQESNVYNNNKDGDETGLYKLRVEYNNFQNNNLPTYNDLIINPITRNQTNSFDTIPMFLPESLRETEEQPTGFGANIDINKIANVLGLQSINIQLPKQKEASGYAGYTNPLTGNNRIFTREEIGAMNDDEFAQNEKEIMAQIQAMNGIMPTNGDMLKESITGGGVVYVQSYTRSDGTKVQGYYRSRPGL